MTTTKECIAWLDGFDDYAPDISDRTKAIRAKLQAAEGMVEVLKEIAYDISIVEDAPNPENWPHVIADKALTAWRKTDE